jgi:hypothetical protein
MGDCMYTPTRAALMGKTVPDLVHQLRMLGADSQRGESKESIINRILLFQKQEFRPDVKIERIPVIPVTEEELFRVSKPYMLRGLKLDIRDGSWFAECEKRKDSGTLSMPLAAIERAVKYLMPECYKGKNV